MHKANFDDVEILNKESNFIKRKFKEAIAIKKNNSESNWIRTHNHLVHKRTLNHLAKLAK